VNGPTPDSSIGDGVPSVEEVTQCVVQICAPLLRGVQPEPDDSLSTRGASSLVIICVVAKLHETYGLPLDPLITTQILFSTPTPRSIADCIHPRIRAAARMSGTHTAPHTTPCS
jgi:hypothetical protein